MAWEGIEEKLKTALTVKVSFPAGTIWLPDHHLSIDDWLTSISETDEELSELDLPRIRFLQNRWPIEKLVELQVIVAKTTRDGGPSGKILFDERTHHVTLKTILVIHDVIGDSDLLGDAASVVNVIQGTAASMNSLWHSFAASKSALVPKLHREPDDIVPLGAQHGRDGGRIHTARHGYRDGV